MLSFSRIKSEQPVGGVGNVGGVGTVSGVGNVGGVASIGNVGGVASIGSVGGVPCIGNVGGVPSIGNVGGVPSIGNVGGVPCSVDASNADNNDPLKPNPPPGIDKKVKRNPVGRPPTKKREFALALNVSDSDVPGSKGTYSNFLVSQRRPVTKEEKELALQAARAFNSTNPFFMVVMRPTHVYRAFYMNIPSKFADAHLSREKHQIFLELPDTRRWPVNCNYRKKYAGFGKGWLTFAMENNLEEGDVCIFEYVNCSDFTLRVHIFRVVQELVPLCWSRKKETEETGSRSKKAAKSEERMETPKGFV